MGDGTEQDWDWSEAEVIEHELFDLGMLEDSVKKSIHSIEKKLIALMLRQAELVRALEMAKRKYREIQSDMKKAELQLKQVKEL